MKHTIIEFGLQRIDNSNLSQRARSFYRHFILESKWSGRQLSVVAVSHIRWYTFAHASNNLRVVR